MSILAYRLYLMRRALARPDTELSPRYRPRYEAKARELATRLIAGESDDVSQGGAA